MINPDDKDIGRGVIYKGMHPNAIPEEGCITSFNEKWVFVRYANQHPTCPGQATDRLDLRWLSGTDNNKEFGAK